VAGDLGVAISGGGIGTSVSKGAGELRFAGVEGTVSRFATGVSRMESRLAGVEGMVSRLAGVAGSGSRLVKVNSALSESVSLSVSVSEVPRSSIPSFTNSLHRTPSGAVIWAIISCRLSGDGS
jgi:hypothetical protein